VLAALAALAIGVASGGTLMPAY